MAKFPAIESKTLFQPIEISLDSWDMLVRICGTPIKEKHRKEIVRAINNLGYNLARLDEGINSGEYNKTRTTTLNALKKASRGLKALSPYTGHILTDANSHDDFYRASTASIEKIRVRLSFDPPVIKPCHIFILELTSIWVSITGKAPIASNRSERDPDRDKADAGNPKIQQYAIYRVRFMEFLAKFLEKRRTGGGFIEFITFALMQMDDNTASQIVTGTLVGDAQTIIKKRKSEKSEASLYRELLFESPKSKSKN